MSNADTFAGVAACPACGDRHWFEDTTELFLPVAGELRRFTPGVWQDVAIRRFELDDWTWLGWWRVRKPDPSSRHVSVLDKIERLRRCGCGLRMATVLDFEVGVGAARLAELRLVDAFSSKLSAEVDFARLLEGPPYPSEAELAQLLGSPVDVRAAYLTRLVERGFADERDPARLHVVGPVTCEACGETRERDLPTHLDSFFRASGTLFLGSRLPLPEALDADRDRDFHLRLRHPIPDDALAILGSQRSMGCRCGAGRAALVTRFARRPGEVELVELSLRVVRTAAELADLDYAHGMTRAHGPRDRLVAAILAAFVHD